MDLTSGDVSREVNTGTVIIVACDGGDSAEENFNASGLLSRHEVHSCQIVFHKTRYQDQST